MTKGYVHFKYTKLVLSIGGDINNREPNKMFKTSRVSKITNYLLELTNLIFL